MNTIYGIYGSSIKSLSFSRSVRQVQLTGVLRDAFTDKPQPNS
jgi:hypothetical protein